MNWRLLFLIIFSSCIDMVLWSIMAKPFPYLLRALFYTTIGIHAPLALILATGLLSLLPLFFITGTLGIDLFILVPLWSFFYWVCSFVGLPRALLFIPIFCAVLLQSLFDNVVAGITFDFMAVFYAFLSTLVMVCLSPGSQGNRSRSERKVRTPNERGTLGN